MTRNLPASVRQRLLNRSRETKRPFQELLAYYAMERFLYRLGQSPYVDRFVLKGALMFTVWGTPRSRPTKDIDLLAHTGNSVETVVAEKFEAMSKRGLVNSRMKDFYDLLVLSRHLDFDGTTLRSAMLRTFRNRSTDVQAMPIALSAAFAGDATKQAQWEGFLRKTRLDGAPASLQSVIDELTPFLRPVAAAIQDALPFDARWEAPGPWRST